MYLPDAVFATPFESKEEGNDQESINHVPYLTRDTISESDKMRKHHTQESQKVSPFQAGDHKAANNRQ